MRKTEDKIFKTDNFPLAAFLLSQRCELLSIDKSRRRASFVFAETAKRQDLTEKFWRYRASVEPRGFFSAQKDLKNMLFSESYPA